MKINVLHLIEGAKQAVGLTVIIDVFRAFSVACYVMNNGADKIIPVGDISIAYSLKEQNPNYVLMGERKGKIQKGFDFGNSPTYIENVDFSGKTVIHTTSAGTQGIANAINSDEIITGSLVNAHAIAKYIKKQNPEIVSLVCMGLMGMEQTPEDILCANYIKSILENNEFDIKKGINSLKETTGAVFFESKNSDWGPEGDFALCTDIGKFNFVLKLEKDTNNFYFKKIVI